MSKTACIIGSGQIGYAIARRLLRDGWSVSLAHRSESDDPELTAAGATAVSLDRHDDSAMARWLSCGADLLVDTVAFNQAEGQQLLKFQKDIGSLCVIS